MVVLKEKKNDKIWSYRDIHVHIIIASILKPAVTGVIYNTQMSKFYEFWVLKQVVVL